MQQEDFSQTYFLRVAHTVWGALSLRFLQLTDICARYKFSYVCTYVSIK